MMPQIVDTRRYHYPRTKVRGPDGKVKYSQTNWDSVARAMWDASRAEMEQTVEENSLGSIMVRHARLNDGHYRMILGHALRAVIRAGRPVAVRGHTIRSLAQKVPLPPGYRQEKVAYKERGAPAE